MKRRLFLGGLGAIGALALTSCGGPVYKYRFRMTAEIDTPDGVRSGSSVLEMVVEDDSKVRWFPPEARAVRRNLTGEAVFVDLGGGRHLIALLAQGPTAQGLDVEFVERVYGRIPLEHFGAYQKTPGVYAIPQDYRPTMVTFRDLADPASAQVVYATGRDVRLVPTSPGASTSSYKDFGPLVIDRFAEIFGPGFALKRVTIEMTSDPLTRGIEGKLPAILSKVRELDKSLQVHNPGDPLKVRSGHLSIP